jgi:hypothetical protein
VLDAGSIPLNRPPLTPAAITFDPPAPTTNDAIFCRLTVPPVQDLDYDVVGYEYHWFITGRSYRRVTNAAFADAIPRGVALPDDSVRCVVTPWDGQQLGMSIEATIAGAIRPALQIRMKEDKRAVISWSTSVLSYNLEFATNPGTWNPVSQKPFRSGSEMTVTNPLIGPTRFFRLTSP